MYDITDKRNPTRELQHYLRTISHATEGMPHAPTDGFYGETTEAAVRFFQEIYGLPVTGVVSFPDWQAIYLLYRHILRDRTRPTLLPPVSLPLLPQSEGDDIYLLQTLLGANGSPAPRLTGRYDAETERAVRAYQRTRMLPPSGITDLVTWEALCEDYRRSNSEGGAE